MDESRKHNVKDKSQAEVPADCCGVQGQSIINSDGAEIAVDSLVSGCW